MLSLFKKKYSSDNEHIIDNIIYFIESIHSLLDTLKFLAHNKRMSAVVFSDENLFSTT
jgi:hypothetical protein